MISFRKIHAVAIAAAVTFCLSASEKLVAATPDAAPNITYTATGTLTAPALVGADVFKLAGEPFTISVVVNAAATPSSHGANWAKYTMLKMTLSVGTGLEPTPYTASSKSTSLELATGNPAYDLFVMFAQVPIAGTPIQITGTLHLPTGTFAKPLAHPFPSVALGPCVAPGPCSDTVVYTDPSTHASTTLGVASGTVQATIPGGGVENAAIVQLHANAMQVITAHADGTKTMRSVGTLPVDLGESTDSTALQFYASGVRDASEVHVQIGGHEVPLLYAGPAGHFPGLDEVSVKLPRSLAGSGNVDVEMSVDGRSATPAHIQIQ